MMTTNIVIVSDDNMVRRLGDDVTSQLTASVTNNRQPAITIATLLVWPAVAIQDN